MTLAGAGSSVTLARMTRQLLSALLFLSCLAAQSAELQIELEKFRVDEPPPGFTSLLNGQGQPGDWKVILDDVPPTLAPLTPQARAVTKRPVIAQLGADPTDERFPILVYENEVFGDFQMTCRVKTVSGKTEQMAGLVFRLQDENNFYVVRVSSLGNTFRFYKVVGGARSTPLGPEIDLPTGTWQEITVSCSGNRIDCLLNGKPVIPTLTDNSFTAGKVGLWTKSDSVSYFTDLRMNYTPRIPVAQSLVDDALKQFSRLVGLRVYAELPDSKELQVIASTKTEERGMKAAEDYHRILAGEAYAYGKTRETVTIALPLRDRNGDVVGVVRAEMERFPGQTENNAIARAIPIAKLMERRIKSRRDLIE